MKITFLGGGNEIGASSAIVEIGSARLLIDCGIRMSGDFRLPDLAEIQKAQAGQLDAVLLTHAHMDHSGALPVLHQHFPGVPVYSTSPTRGLVEVLLRDSLNIMRAKAESENELPLYTPAAAESLLEKMLPVPFGSPLQIGRTGATATWFPAGHILGAASIGIEAVEEGRTIKVLFSGDIAVSDQLTVPGMLPSRDFKPDVLVIESTYGDRLHSPRELEEQRLLEMVAGVIENKGKLLIPAFAIGRAQEVILMLLKQFRGKKLASFPVYIDGMVRTICGVYSKFPAHQTAYSRRLIEKHGNPFFNVVDEIRAVASPAEREKVLAGEPCVIIASSGMLTGGASAFYAPHIVGDERNGIAITGYQDEESPGRQLLELADQQTRELAIAGKVFDVKCSVAKYSLSAHADCNEISGLIEAINPREIVLVHGEGSARPALAELLKKQGTRYRPVHLPRTGDSLNFGATRRAQISNLKSQISNSEPVFGQGESLSAEGLRRMAESFRANGEEGKLFSEVDLLNRWHGASDWDEEQYVELIRLLDDSQDFRRPKSRPHLYRLIAPEAEESKETGGVLFASMQEIEARVERAFTAEQGLYHKGFDQDSHNLRLSFEFPAVARRLYLLLIEEIVAGTGWTYSIKDQPHQTRLAEVALGCVPAGALPKRSPAIHHDRQEIVLTFDAPIDAAEITAATAKFAELTGWTLKLQTPLPAQASPTETPVPSALAVDPVEYKFAVGTLRKPLNFKTASDAIEEACAMAPQHCQPSKLSQKSDHLGPYIEAAFVTPPMGLRMKRTLAAMAEHTGWRIRIKQEPNLIALIETATRLIPPECGLKKQPGIHKEFGLVRAKVTAVPDAVKLKDISEEFEELTGYRLEIIG